MENVVCSELVIDWNIKYLLGQSANNLQTNRHSISGSYADYLEIFIQQNKKNLCNLCDCWDHKYPVSSRAKKLNDDKYHMIKFPFPILDSVYNFILIHFLLTYVNIRES